MAFRDALVGGLAGALGATLVGAVLSSATVRVISGTIGSSVLPPGAVVLSRDADCGGGVWEKDDQASGRFLVGAGKTSDSDVTFEAGGQRAGHTRIALSLENLPPVPLTVHFDQMKAGFQAGDSTYTSTLTDKPADIPGSYPLTAGGASQPIDITPPAYGLTACRHR